MSNLKRNLILISCFLIIAAHIYCLIAEVTIYPFAQYNMFAFAKKEPTYKTLYLYGIDSLGAEFSLDQDKKFFFKPFNQRGFYNAIYDTIKHKDTKHVLYSLTKRAHNLNPQVKGLRLYGLTCDCAHFVDLETIDLPTYFTKYCKRWLVDETLL